MPVFNHIPSFTPRMLGATAETNGDAGLVPAPQKGDENKFLRGDGTWQEQTQTPSQSTGSDAQTLQGRGIGFWNAIPEVKDSGIMEIGKYIDFHDSKDDTSNYVVRVRATKKDEEVASNNLYEIFGKVRLMNESGRTDEKEISAPTQIQINSDLKVVRICGYLETGAGEDNGPYFRPPIALDGGVRLGTSNARFGTIFSRTSAINTSDRNLKNSIKEIDERYEKLFFDLKPVTYKFNDGQSGRTHTGFISQDVEESLEKSGITALDFAAFCKDNKIRVLEERAENGLEQEEIIEGEYDYSLRYEEFIALNTHMIQKLFEENEQLKVELSEMKEMIQYIMNKIEVN